MSGFGGHSESSRWPPLAKMMMSTEVATEAPKPLTPKQKFDRWYATYPVLWFQTTNHSVLGWSMKDTDECKFIVSIGPKEKKKNLENESLLKNIYSFVGVFILLHLLVFGFGFIHYSLKVRISTKSIGDLILMFMCVY